ncbi:MAG: phenylalanine--tRNA ligase subunit alpha [archaeon]|nr:phenylalanine--tRNA ligase subunit alpha [archaeon]
MDKKEQNIPKNEIIESLSLNERKILPHLKDKTISQIIEDSQLEEVAVLRSLEYLSNKKILVINKSQTKIVELGLNGVLYKQKGLPERRLVNIIAERKKLSLRDAQKSSGLTDNEFQAALGALKKRALVAVVEGNIIFSGTREEISRKSLEEQFLEILPCDYDKLTPEQKFGLEALKNRKNIIEINAKNKIEFTLTDFGKELVKNSDKIIQESKDFIEALTPEILANNSWKGKKFRRYDLKSPVPRISGGKRHFVNQATDYARKIWTDLGFKEMKSTLVQTGFWNFDALFTAQDHPVREIQDTFYIKDVKGKLPDRKIVNAVKEAHEKGVAGAKGWRYSWKEDEAKKVILRTHTTCISANTLAMLGQLKNLKNKTGKFFAVGKCFRNETVDWGHLFEFNQTEGIVVDPNANFRNLFGYLDEFFKKMGFEKVKFVPSFFPYTEPSVEIYGYNSMRKVWMEIGGAGIMRPEVVVPLLGEYIPVLAWGPGFDRSIMEYYEIKDLREMYANDLIKLRAMKFWNK